jgi:hypothetical protein
LTPRELNNLAGTVQVLRLLPECVVREASGGADDLEEFLWYPTNILGFAERLVSLAGLAALALYTNRLVSRKPAADVSSDRDQLMENYLLTALFDRGYSLGHACSIIQRCGAIKTGALARVVDHDRPLAAIVTSRPESPGNLLRGQLHNPPEDQLLDLAESLSFLRDFDFHPVDDAPCVRFRKQQLEIRPFLFWDGSDLWCFKRMMREEEENDHILYLSTAAGTERREPERMDSVVRRRIAHVAELLGCEAPLDKGAPIDEVLPQSFMPLFAQSYPEMNRLAQRLYQKSSHATRSKLWVEPAVGDEHRAHKLLSNEVYVTNAIIKQCMDRDPVSVMEAYFLHEPAEIDRYFTYLVHDATERRRLRQQIRTRVSEYKNDLFPFYCQSEHQDELSDLVDRYRARLVAQRVVQLSGFPIIENVAQEGLNDYIRRTRTFYSYLDSYEEVPDAAKVREGLLACSRAAEAILKTMILFYQSLRWYRHDHQDSIDEVGVSLLNKCKEGLRWATFGQLVCRVQQIDNDREVRERLESLLGRERLWPERGHQHALAAVSELHQWNALKDLKSWRDEQVHRRPGPIEKAARLVKGFLEFLDWLQDALRQPGQNWQIFPALLSLNLVTRNSCGISSIKYTLVSHDTGSKHHITLYTKQPLSVTSGSFFGLPHLNKTIKDHWVDPVLIPSGLFLVSSSVEDKHA